MKNVLVVCLLCFVQISLAEQDRQRPGKEPKKFPRQIYETVPEIKSSASEFVPVPDRWRQFYTGKWYDPYNQNILKGDLPIFGSPGKEWFLELDLISETTIQKNKISVPVGIPSTIKEDRSNTLGNSNTTAVIQNLITSVSLIRGDTTFRPPDYELRITPVFNVSHVEAEETGVLLIDPSRDENRTDGHIGFLELFADIHLADISERYDFISSRLGIQEFISDFRGFVYSDAQPGVRLFGNYDNNKWQGNLAWFHRLEKDTNSGINTNFDSRHENVFIANLFRQDAPVYGHNLSLSVLHHRDDAGDHSFKFDDNGFLRRPASIGDERSKNIHSTYIGLTGDGHFGRVNSTSAFYYATGREEHNQIAGRGQDISAFMLAQELSYDFDWLRTRGSFFWSSGDDDPFDDKAEGFDAIFDVPNFAGGDLSYWQRQGIPLVAGGEVFLTNQQSLLPNLRAGKEHGQSNFVNPGLFLFNLGLDVEVTPKLKLITNASYLRFDDTAVLETVRQDGTFGKEIGFDLSAGLIYRPFLNNNVKFRFGAAALLPGDGIKTLYGDNTLYHIFTDFIFEY